MAVLQSHLSAMTNEQLIALVGQMQKQGQRTISFKVTAPKADKDGNMVGTSGAISAYGLGRFPVTLYAEQWERLMSMRAELDAFIAANRPLLSVKPIR